MNIRKNKSLSALVYIYISIYIYIYLSIYLSINIYLFILSLLCSIQARIQKILNLGSQLYKLSGWTGGGGANLFFVLHKGGRTGGVRRVIYRVNARLLSIFLLYFIPPLSLSHSLLFSQSSFSLSVPHCRLSDPITDSVTHPLISIHFVLSFYSFSLFCRVSNKKSNNL